MRKIFCVIAICSATNATAAELVLTCKLGPGPSQSVAVVRDLKIASTHVYYLQRGKVRTPFFGSLDNSRGSFVRVECVGKKQRALIVSGEFTANALQGFAITNYPGSARSERLDFAEKSRPMRLYLSPHEMLIVVATGGFGETGAKYVAYRHVAGRGEQDQAQGMNDLPSPPGFDVLDLNDR
ncbi:MAG: hypothetical protein ABIQ08_14435 [Duganella sp.]